MSVAKRIVDRLLENDADEFIERNWDNLDEFPWKQIGGDFGDAWTYGGDWYHQPSRMIVHIAGLEGEGIKDVESWDIKLSPEELAAIEAQFPRANDDPDIVNDNENNRDEAIENLKCEKAEARNKAVEMPVYRFLDEPLDDWVTDKIPSIVDSMFNGDMDLWNELPDAQKWLAVGQHLGFEELDHAPDRFSKEALSKYLKIDL